MSVEGEMACLRRSSWSALALEDDDLLSEILLRLPLLPSSLPCASLVCKRWRRLVSDPGFLRRFRSHHRRSPPLLGYLYGGTAGLSFVPTLQPPNRVPGGRFSLQFDDDDDDDRLILSCRDGLALILNQTHLEVLVWDPVTGDQRLVAVPPGFDDSEGAEVCNGAVLRTAGDVHGGCHSSPFQVVLVSKDEQGSQALACVYSSETGIWGDIISTPLVSMSIPSMVSTRTPSALVGNSLYWSLVGKSPGILEFDFDRQQLAVIPVPHNIFAVGECSFWVMPMEGGELGILYLSGLSAQYGRGIPIVTVLVHGCWEKTIELGKLLS